ncbi:MAG: hypothetical protein M3179_15335 [Actinomycetota bacterium]|nr:hypothetical protein [Actinomycetota bacterium]
MHERLSLTNPIERSRGRRWLARTGALLAALVLAPAFVLVVSPVHADHEQDGHTPYCDSGKTPNFSFRNNMENPASGNWSFAHTPGAPDWSYRPSRPDHVNTGPDTPKGTTSLNAADADRDTDKQTTATRSATFTPVSGTQTYVRFTHFGRGLDAEDGVVVEYSANGGRGKT